MGCLLLCLVLGGVGLSFRVCFGWCFGLGVVCWFWLTLFWVVVWLALGGWIAWFGVWWFVLGWFGFGGGLG